MAGLTNRGRYRFLDILFRNGAEPTNLYLALVTSATRPTSDTNTLGDLVQVAAGNGYTSGGYQLARNSTDFDTLTQDDVNNKAIIKIKDIVWTASGGSIPASGDPPRWVVLTDDNATMNSREVYAFWDLLVDSPVSSGNTLTLQDLTITWNE